MTFRLPLQDPPLRVQEDHHCWSAAYDSWTTACSRIFPGARAVSEADIQARLSRFPGALDEDGGATRGGIGLLSTQGDLVYHAVSGANLTTELLRAQLTQFGYVYLVFWGRSQRTRRMFSHAVVVSDAVNGRIRVMDPAGSRGLDNQQTEYYNNATVMLLGTHRRAH